MKLATFNIRYDCGHDGINNFSCRKEMILETIRREAPDIIGFQEVLPHVAVWLKEALTDYYIVGCPRCEDLTGEQVCIAFHPDRFNLMKMDTFWLSPTPYVPGSRFPVSPAEHLPPHLYGSGAAGAVHRQGTSGAEHPP